MANLLALKRRIKSVNNTLKTTSAMQLISSVKMRRAVESAEKSRTFAASAEEILSRLLGQHLGVTHPLLLERPAKTVTLVAIAADKGLAGSFNADVVRQTQVRAKEWAEKGVATEVIAVGKRAASGLARAGVTLVASFETFGDSLEFFEASPVGQLILARYATGETDRVEVIYKKFVSTLRQETVTTGLIPVAKPEAADAKPWPYTFEPDPESVLDSLLPYLIRMRLFQLMLESNASEHAARMVAMQSATDAGRELVSDLVFTANTIRQEKITAEVAEITAGSAALS